MVEPFDATLLTALQDDFPLEARPYRVIAERMGSDEETVFARVAAASARGMVRRLGPRYESRRLGRVSTLVAAAVGAQRMEPAAAAVCARREVTHCYERSGSRYDLWFTLASDSTAAVGELLEALREQTGVCQMHSLPAEKVYKLGVRFQLEGAAPRKPQQREQMSHIELRELDRRIVRATQRGLPLVMEPYADVAKALGVTPGEVIARLEAMKHAGVIRSMGAILDGPSLGYRGNALVAGRVEGGTGARGGAMCAGFAEVSHCYRRPALADFPYRLYTMVHGRDREASEAVVGRMSSASGLGERVMLATVREFKKTSTVLSEPDPDEAL